MLEELSVENLLIIDGLKVALHPRLNVISGETGVGKSLLLAAIGALFGERLAVPTSEDRELRIEGRFVVDARLRARLPESLRDEVDDHLVVRIQKKPGGAQRTWVNGAMASRQELRALGDNLVDVHGQHDMQRLLAEGEQVEALDAFAGTTELRTRFNLAYRRFEEAKGRLASRSEREAFLRDRLDLARFQLTELETADVRVGELEDLSRRFRVLARRAEIVGALEQARGLLEEDGNGAHDVLVRAGRAIERQADGDDDSTALAERCFTAAESVRDLARDLQDVGRRRSTEEDAHETIGPRLDALNHLQRKYRTDERGLLKKRDDLRREVAAWETEAATLAGLDDDVVVRQAEMLEVGTELAKRRAEAGAALAARIEAEFGDLRMAQARFRVDSGWHDGHVDGAVGASGYGRPRFSLRANPGSPWADLSEAASGGELARVMLALKSVLAESHDVPILVFDEIETGVGPRLGSVLGRRLAALSRHHQVICITHLPQIAVFADRHLKITKSIEDGVTRTRLLEVDGVQRLDELAAMLGGGDERLARRQAKSLLDEASRHDAVAEGLE